MNTPHTEWRQLRDAADIAWASGDPNYGALEQLARDQADKIRAAAPEYVPSKRAVRRAALRF